MRSKLSKLELTVFLGELCASVVIVESDLIYAGTLRAQRKRREQIGSTNDGC
jgi:hypothetical protein